MTKSKPKKNEEIPSTLSSEKSKSTKSKKQNTELSKKEVVEVHVAGIVLDTASNTPIVILKPFEEEKCLPLWVGILEATSISDALQGVVSPRPMTHDLITSIIENTGIFISSVSINTLIENTFMANLEVSSGDEIKLIDSRPSDAIAIAVRIGCPIYIEKKLFESSGISITEIFPRDLANKGMSSMKDTGTMNTNLPSSKTTKDTLKEGQSYDNSTPDQYSDGIFFVELDEEKMKEILQDVKPEDFKYKI